VVPNDRVATLCQNNMSLLNAFKNADEVLHNGVRAISELITIPGLINLDFADVRTIMQARGRALMGIGVAEGEDRAVRAAQEAIVCPLLEQSNINGAMGVIVNIKGGCDIGMREVQDAVTAVKESAHPDANIIFGAVVDEQERPEIQVTVIAAGFPTGVSDEFLSSDGKAEFEMPAPALPKRSPDRPVELNSKPAPSASTATEKSTSNTKPPAEQFLFPEESNEPAPPSTPEPEEDLGIPAFLRKRMRKNK
jgi:cell division protein FtsZ